MTKPATAVAEDATPAPAATGFVIYQIPGEEDRMPMAYDDPAWQEAIKTELGAVILDDSMIEGVSFDPLTFVLAPGVEAPKLDGTFIATLGGERLYAGGVTRFESAKARYYPVITVHDTVVAKYVVVTPQLGHGKDSALTLPAALADHFRARGPIQPGPRPKPRFAKRRFVGAVTATKPGDPTSQVEASCDDKDACTITISYRRPGTRSPTWDQTETHDLPLAEFDAVWDTVENSKLMSLDPKPARADRVIHPPRYRIAAEAVRGTTTIANDREWQTPSNWDSTAVRFLKVVGALGTKHAKTVPVSYFPT
jgi:hypothetical protein